MESQVHSDTKSEIYSRVCFYDKYLGIQVL